MKKKELLTEEIEIQKELESDDITPIQDKVSKLFDDVGAEEIVEESSDTVTGLDWTDIAETLNHYLNDPDLEDNIIQDLHRSAKE